MLPITSRHDIITTSIPHYKRDHSRIIRRNLFHHNPLNCPTPQRFARQSQGMPPDILQIYRLSKSANARALSSIPQ
jgi:hypothetical protein